MNQPVELPVNGDSSDAGKFIHELVTEQALMFPSIAAIRDSEQEITYGELEDRANNLSNLLKSRGVGPEIFVGIGLPRSIDAAIALLAVLKTGGAYVPLDPGYPIDRLSYMIEDSAIRFVITSTRHSNSAISEIASVIFIDRLEDSSDVVESSPRAALVPDNAAVIIYTSGSTGRPRGVVATHRCLIARLNAGPLPDFIAGDICCWNSSLNFGISSSRLLLPLACGLTVVIPTQDECRDALQFLRALQRLSVTSFFTVPAMLHTLLLLAQADVSSLSGVRAIAVGGDVLTSTTVKLAARVIPHATLINLYGSTEIGTTALMKVIDFEVDQERPTQGRPLKHTHVCLLDHDMEPVSEGEVGELYVGCDHLSRGYLNCPELTALSFLPDSLRSEHASKRMLRTGDRFLKLPNGDFEFVGRSDSLVKVRGYRIDLQEIESALCSHASVAEAAVSAIQYEDRRIIAYVVRQENEQLMIAELREYLALRLPEFMLPASFIFVHSLPRTLSGKLDRQALQTPTALDIGISNQYEPPRYPGEIWLTDLWQDKLGVAGMGIEDDFFELGGDSLVATRIAFDISRKIGRDCVLSDVFQNPTIRSLWSWIQNTVK